MLLYGTVFSTFIITRMALIAEHSTTANRAQLYGWMNITWSISNFAGPLLAGVLVETGGWLLLFLVATGLAALTLPLIARLPEESSSHRIPAATMQRSWHAVRDPPTLRVITMIAGIQLAMCTGMGVISPVLPLYLTEIYAASPAQVGVFLSLGVGVATILTQIPSGLLADRYGSWRVLTACAVATPLLYVIASAITQYDVLILVYMAINGAWSMTWPSSMAHLVNAIPPTARSLGIGIRQTAVRLGFTIGPLLGGYLWSLYEGSAGTPVTSFYIAAACFGSSLLPLILLRSHS
jgi:predicted MFS family arabinose efflux permease